MLPDFFAQVYCPHRLAGGSIGTSQNYHITLRHFARFLRRPARLKDLTENNLLRFLVWLVAVRHQKSSTANVNLKRLLALAHYAYRKQRLKKEPEVQLLREPGRVPRAYRVDQISKMLLAAAQMPGQIEGVPACKWWPALIQTIYWTGIRKTAALSIVRANVDLAERTLLIPAETQKQYADQLFRLHPDCVAAITQIWGPERKLLFPWSYAKGTLYNRFRELLKMAGLPSSRSDLFQKIRRTTYSYSKLGGIDAGRQLGHSSDMSRYYEDPTITQERQACDVLPRPEPPRPKLRVIG